MSNKRKELVAEFKRNPPAAGVFQIRNLMNGKVFIGAAENVPGVLRRHEFELKMGGHRNRALQADWQAQRGEGFALELLDELKPESGRNVKAELKALEALWLEQLQPYGERGYHTRTGN